MKITILEKSLLTGFIFTVLASLTGFFGECQSINDKIFRLHVLANSDNLEDQNLKLQVRDRILKDSSKRLSSASNKEEARCLAKEHLDQIKIQAEDEISKRGYNYPVKLELEKTHFDTRKYEDVTLPAGEYDALRVLIGEGEGKNWWCVMFPNMCLPAAQEKNEKNDKQKIENILSKNEIDLVKNEKQYEIRFKIVEWYEFLKENTKSIFCH